MCISPQSVTVNACFVTCTQKQKRVTEPSKRLIFNCNQRAASACSGKVQSDEPGE